jgi:ribosome-binding protein aMBF1 (putative translation factor)
MPAKKAPAKKAEPKAPEPTLLEGFATVDYEGNEMFVCDRCGFDTFSTEVAASHLSEHTRTDAEAELRSITTEHLAETAQVTTEEAPE